MYLRFLLVIGLILTGLSYSQAQTVPIAEQGARLAERFEQPVNPRSQAPQSLIKLESTTPPAQAAAIQLNVSSISVAGSTVFTQAEIADIIGTVTGEVSLSVVFDAAERLTQQYRDDGFILSRVIVPPQELDPSGADVQLQVIEGYIDKVEWPSQVDAYRNLFSHYSDKITASRPLNIKVLERYLLLAGDLPSLDFSSTLRPSKTEQGASTLVVSVTQKKFDAAAQLDNRGTDGRGPIQYTLFGSVHNALKQHESLQLTYAGTPETDELQFIGGSYSQVINSEGLELSISGSYDTGEPGSPALSAIAFESQSFSVSGELSFPVIRRRERNLTLSGIIFARNLTNEALGSTLSEDRLRGFRISAAFDQFDKFNGVTQVIGTFSQGIDGFGSTDNANTLASRSAGRVDFSKAEINLSRFQNLPNNFSLVSRVNAQLAFTPLLSSEECTYGGSAFGRAFEPSVLAGDSCVQLNTEIRYDAKIPNNPLSQTQFYSFVDYGAVFTREPAIGSPDSDEAASIGLGVRLGWKDTLNGTFEGARRIAGDVGNDSWQFFFNLSARY